MRLSKERLEAAWDGVIRNWGSLGLEYEDVEAYDVAIDENLRDLVDRIDQGQVPFDRSRDPIGSAIIEECLRRELIPLCATQLKLWAWQQAPEGEVDQEWQIDLPHFFEKIPPSLVLKALKQCGVPQKTQLMVEELIGEGLMDPNYIQFVFPTQAQGGQVSGMLSNLVLAVIQQRLKNEGYVCRRPLPETWVIGRLTGQEKKVAVHFKEVKQPPTNHGMNLALRALKKAFDQK